jgi:micrococcal nuclease
MKKEIILLLFLLLFISSCGITGNVIREPKLEGPFKVTNVVDGDTLDLNNGDRIRLSGINTPETGECYYQQAKDKLKDLTLGKEVYLEKDFSNTGKYGRLLRYIYVDDIMANSVLVLNGFAKVYHKYKEDTSRYEELSKLEKIAIEKNLGLWNCKDTKEDCLYVKSKNSKTYHKPGCKFAKKINPENLICIKDIKEIEGLTLCKICQ